MFSHKNIPKKLIFPQIAPIIKGTLLAFYQRNMSSIFRKKRKISVSCRGPPKQRNMSSIFCKKRKISVFGVNGTSFLQVIQRKQRNQIVTKKKSGKKKGRKKKTKKCPALLRLLYFLPLMTGPYRPHYRFGS